VRLQGRLTEWNDDRGFGFVTPLDGGPRVFVHVSQFPRDKRRPIVMDLVTYTVGHDDQGRTCGQDVLFLTPTHAARVPRAAAPMRGPRRVPAILVILAGLFVVSLVLAPLALRDGQDGTPATSGTATYSATDDAISRAFSEQRSGVQVAGEGVVERVLSDDTNGSRHQRFILRLGSGQTLLVAHNIDLAPKLAIGPGDLVSFFGEYEWNSEGGVIHWTHHDPQRRHVGGWLKHEGRTFQ